VRIVKHGCIPTSRATTPATSVGNADPGSAFCCIPTPHESVPATGPCAAPCVLHIRLLHPHHSANYPCNGGRDNVTSFNERVASPPLGELPLQLATLSSAAADDNNPVASPPLGELPLQPALCSTFSDPTCSVRTRLAGCYGLLRSFLSFLRKPTGVRGEEGVCEKGQDPV